MLDSTMVENDRNKDSFDLAPCATNILAPGDNGPDRPPEEVCNRVLGWVVDPENCARSLAQAQVAQLTNNHAGALRMYDAVAQAFPGEWLPPLLRAHCLYFHMDRPIEAHRDVNKCIMIAPNCVVAYELSAYMHAVAGERGLAEKDIANIERLAGPKARTTWTALLLYLDHRYFECIELCAPKETYACKLLEIACLMKLRRFDEASALVRNPNRICLVIRTLNKVMDERCGSNTLGIPAWEMTYKDRYRLFRIYERPVHHAILHGLFVTCETFSQFWGMVYNDMWSRLQY